MHCKLQAGGRRRGRNRLLYRSRHMSESQSVEEKSVLLLSLRFSRRFFFFFCISATSSSISLNRTQFRVNCRSHNKRTHIHKHTPTERKKKSLNQFFCFDLSSTHIGLTLFGFHFNWPIVFTLGRLASKNTFFSLFYISINSISITFKHKYDEIPIKIHTLGGHRRGWPTSLFFFFVVASQTHYFHVRFNCCT